MPALTNSAQAFEYQSLRSEGRVLHIISCQKFFQTGSYQTVQCSVKPDIGCAKVSAALHCGDRTHTGPWEIKSRGSGQENVYLERCGRAAAGD